MTAVEDPRCLCCRGLYPWPTSGCVLHAAAPDLLAALEMAGRYLTLPEVIAVVKLTELQRRLVAVRADAAIAKAKNPQAR